MKVFDYIEIQQPIGTFYMCCINASTLLKYVSVKARGAFKEGIQRGLSMDRVRAVGQYCSDPDAMFPTPIVVSIDENAPVKIDESLHKIIFMQETIVGDVIDGQHRLWGIQESEFADKFNLPVVFMFGLTVDQKAYVFSTINNNQKKVEKSLIFDLFDVSTYRSPYKTVHQIARVMNYDEASPLFSRLKMLGKKTDSQMDATLSQGTFAKSIMMLLTKKPDFDTLQLKKGEQLLPDDRLPLRQYFIDSKDEIITKIIMNCFSAVKEVFPNEWKYPNSNILWKTTGFRAIIYALPTMIRKGKQESNLSQSFFVKCFAKFRDLLIAQSITLTSESFPGGGEQSQKKLAAIIVEAVDAINSESNRSNFIILNDLQEYIESLTDPDKYELYDIVMSLDKGVPTYGTVLVELEEDCMVLKCSYLDLECHIPKSRLKECARFVEKNYMEGMDAESWLGYQQAIEKENDE